MCTLTQKMTAVNTSAAKSPKKPTKTEDRSADIERAVAELAAQVHGVRAKYVADKIGKGAEYFVQVLVRANATDLSNGAFRELFTILTYADRDGTNAFPSHQTIAHITGCSVSTSERLVNELAAAKWLQTEHVYSKGHDKAIREVTIPQSSLDNFPAKEAEPRAIKNEGPCAKGHQKRGARAIKNEGVPTTVDRSVRSNRASLAELASTVVNFADARKAREVRS